MSFEGFHIEYLVPDYGVDPDIVPAIIYCDKCEVKAIREAGYMRDVCENITCKQCGNKASRKPNVRRTPE